MGIATGFPMLWLSIFAAAIVFTWIFNSTNGSLLMVIIFHALFDFLSISKAGGAMTATIMSAAVMVGAVLIVVWARADNVIMRREADSACNSGSDTGIVFAPSLFPHYMFS